MDKAAVIYHEGIAEYDFGEGHSMRGDRFPRYIKLLQETGVFSNLGVKLLAPVKATDRDLELVHTREYITKVKKIARENGNLTEDTPLKPSILKAVMLIVGAALKAGELVTEGEYWLAQGVGGGLHHAGPDYGGGWCVFNDVAVCARDLIKRRGLDRVMILDTDAHAGNGTMDIFYDDPQVLYLTIHQDPRTIYPETGFTDQIGKGAGEGYTVNVPLPKGAGDKCMNLALESVFKPIARQFKPQVIIRNGGADPHNLDEIANLALSYNGLWSIGQAVRVTSRELGCNIVDLLCGGYNPGNEEKGLYSILAGLLSMEPKYSEDKPPKEPKKLLEKTESVIDDLRIILRDYWSI